MTTRERLRALIESDGERGQWIKLPDGERMTRATHYKRLSVSDADALRLARLGCGELLTAYGLQAIPYFTQALIAGAMLSGEFDRITCVTPWQFGKSWLMGHASLLLARRGVPVYVGANTGELTSMIMGQAYAAVRDARTTLKSDLIGDAVRKVDKLGASLSRQRIGFANGGAVEAITLGGTYQDTEHNKALGKGGAYILDEAALIPDAVYAETLRSNFARTDGKRYLQAAISNPHKGGWFYDALTGPDSDRHLIVWMDALTAVQDGRWSAEHILEEADTMHADEIQRYLLCELPQEGQGMFLPPVIGSDMTGRHFLGVDSAYKGKDNVTLCDVVLGESLHVREVMTLDKRNWIDGVTSEDIADTVTRVYRALGAELVCVDIGQGIWLVEALTRRGVNVLGINFGSRPTSERVKLRHYAATNAVNKRAEMHLDLQGLMEDGKVTFSEQAADAIRSVIPYITSERKENGKIQVLKKEIIKQYIGRSPDEFDAVLLGIHSAILGASTSDFIV